MGMTDSKPDKRRAEAGVFLAAPGRTLPGDGVAVAVDVIRFSTTAAEICVGCGSVQVGQPNHEDIGRWRTLNPGGLVLAERDGRKLVEADHDNSPDQASRLQTGDRPVLLCSTNGAPLVLSLPPGRTWVAGLVNLSATAALASRLVREAGLRVFVFPASAGFEDEWCARAIMEMAGKGSLTAPELLGDRESVYHQLKSHSLRSEADLRICADVDRHRFIMRLEARLDLNFGLIAIDDHQGGR